MSDEMEDVEVDEPGAEEELEIPAELLSMSDEEDETEATETPADETVETVAASAEDEATPPTAEELGVDTSTPGGKKQFAALLAKWNQWQNRHAAKQKTKPAEPQQPPVATEPTAEAGEAWDPYTVPLDRFVYDGGKESEDSVLSGAEADIDRRIQKGVSEGIKFALNEMRQNDARLRQQTQIGTAQEKLTAYRDALVAHPEWESYAPLVAKILSGTEALAINDPDEWIAMVEARTGISRNWRNEDEPAAPVQNHQRLAKKPVASMTRTISSRRVAPNPAQRTDMDPDEAFDTNWGRFKAAGKL